MAFTAKAHTITIGGKERTLRYSFASFRALGKAAERVIGRTTHWFEWISLDHQELWLAEVCHALTHEDKNLNVDRVAEWFEKLLTDGADIRRAAIWPAQRALGESGVCGRRWTLDEEGKLVWLDEDESGKDSTASQ